MTSVPARALLDTGATVSGIGPRIISQLDLTSYGKKRLKSATDEAFVDYYLFRIGLQASPDPFSADSSIRLPYLFGELDGFSWGRAADFDVILGMDVLSACDVSLGRDGTCQLRYGLS